MKITRTPKLTKKAMRAELARRKLPKSDPARNVRPAPAIWNQLKTMSRKDLVAASAPAPRRATTRPLVTAPAVTVPDTITGLPVSV